MHWLEDKKCCAHRIFLKIDNHNQLLTELRINIYLDKYSNFEAKLQRDI